MYQRMVAVTVRKTVEPGAVRMKQSPLLFAEQTPTEHLDVDFCWGLQVEYWDILRTEVFGIGSFQECLSSPWLLNIRQVLMVNCNVVNELCHKEVGWIKMDFRNWSLPLSTCIYVSFVQKSCQRLWDVMEGRRGFVLWTVCIYQIAEKYQKKVCEWIDAVKGKLKWPICFLHTALLKVGQL
jgi:hypothetical protein